MQLGFLKQPGALLLANLVVDMMVSGPLSVIPWQSPVKLLKWPLMPLLWHHGKGNFPQMCGCAIHTSSAGVNILGLLLIFSWELPQIDLFQEPTLSVLRVPSLELESRKLPRGVPKLHLLD